MRSLLDIVGDVLGVAAIFTILATGLFFAAAFGG